MLIDLLSLVYLPWEIIFGDLILIEIKRKKDYTCKKVVSSQCRLGYEKPGFSIFADHFSERLSVHAEMFYGVYTLTQQLYFSGISPK